MTVNSLIAIVLAIAGVAMIGSASLMLWQVRHRWHEWPVSAYVALAGPLLGAGVVSTHIAVLRLWGEPFVPWFGPNGYGTLASRVGLAIVAVALCRRLVIGHILNTADRKAVKDGRA
jgi:hypothetical protein